MKWEEGRGEAVRGRMKREEWEGGREEYEGKGKRERKDGGRGRVVREEGKW
jgi:hypothetical protein